MLNFLYTEIAALSTVVMVNEIIADALTKNKKGCLLQRINPFNKQKGRWESKGYCYINPLHHYYIVYNNTWAELNIENEPVSDYLDNDIFLNQYASNNVQQFLKDTAAVFQSLQKIIKG